MFAARTFPGRGSPYRNLPCGLPALGLVGEVTGGHKEAEEEAVVLLIGSVIAHCWGEAKVKGWSPDSQALFPRTRFPRPTTKWSREFGPEWEPTARVGFTWWVDAGGDGSEVLGTLSRQFPLLGVPP